jgi:hypothetical protein
MTFPLETGDSAGGHRFVRPNPARCSTNNLVRRCQNDYSGVIEEMTRHMERADAMKMFLAFLALFSTLVSTGCSHSAPVGAQPVAAQHVVPAAAQPVVALHGYELAKTWSEQTMNENIRFAGTVYENWNFGKVAANQKARIDTLEYEMCVEGAQAAQHGDDSLGPQTRAKYKCDSRIDAIEDEGKRLEAESKK